MKTTLTKQEEKEVKQLVADYHDRWLNSKSIFERYFIRRKFCANKVFKGIKREPLLSESWDKVVKDGNNVKIFL